MRLLVQDVLQKNARLIRKSDFRLQIHLASLICYTSFGSNDFQRNFVSLKNLQEITRVRNLIRPGAYSQTGSVIKSGDIRMLIEGLCKHSAC